MIITEGRDVFYLNGMMRGRGEIVKGELLMGGLWFMLQERFVFVLIFMIIILASFFLLMATWKSRVNIPKNLTVTIILISTILIAGALFALIFSLSFGYNS